MDQKRMKEAYDRLYPTATAKRVRDSMQSAYGKLLAGTAYYPDRIEQWNDGKTGSIFYSGKYENKKR